MQDKRKKDLELVTRLAKQFSVLIGEPVRIYRAHCAAIGEYFDFEPESENRNRDTVAIFDTSVLSDSNDISEFQHEIIQTA